MNLRKEKNCHRKHSYKIFLCPHLLIIMQFGSIAARFYWNEEVNLREMCDSVYLGQKPPPQPRRWEPGSGSVLIGDYNCSETLCGFPSVTFLGETSVKTMYNENRVGDPICGASARLFNARVFICVFIHEAVMKGMKRFRWWA